MRDVFVSIANDCNLKIICFSSEISCCIVEKFLLSILVLCCSSLGTENLLSTRSNRFVKMSILFPLSCVSEFSSSEPSGFEIAFSKLSIRRSCCRSICTGVIRVLCVCSVFDDDDETTFSFVVCTDPPLLRFAADNDAAPLIIYLYNVVFLDYLRIFILIWS